MLTGIHSMQVCRNKLTKLWQNYKKSPFFAKEFEETDVMRTFLDLNSAYKMRDQFEKQDGIQSRIFFFVDLQVDATVSIFIPNRYSKTY